MHEPDETARGAAPGEAAGAGDPEAILALAEELLARRFGGEQRLSDPEDLGGSGESTVLRFRVAPNNFLPERTVVVKRLPASATAGADPSLLREIAAYQFTNALPEEVRPGPALLAHDVARRLLVLTDCGDHGTYDELLRATVPAEERLRALRTLGSALGRMHAATASREEGFHTLLHRLWARHRPADTAEGARDRGIVRSIDAGARLLRGHGVVVDEAVLGPAAEAARRIAVGYHRAFTPFDLAPDNILAGDRLSFLDYEWAGFRDVAFDVASVVAGFPQHPGTPALTAEEARAFVETWHAEVRHLWPDIEAEGTLHARITVALLGWTLISVTLLHFGTVDAALEFEEALERGLVEPAAAGGRPATWGGARERADLAQTARALRGFAAESAELAGLVEFADGVLRLFADRGGR